MVESDKNNVDLDLRSVCELANSQLSTGYSPKNDESDESCDESKWGPFDDLDRNAFEKSFEDTDEL